MVKKLQHNFYLCIKCVVNNAGETAHFLGDVGAYRVSSIQELSSDK